MVCLHLTVGSICYISSWFAWRTVSVWIDLVNILIKCSSLIPLIRIWILKRFFTRDVWCSIYFLLSLSYLIQWLWDSRDLKITAHVVLVALGTIWLAWCVIIQNILSSEWSCICSYLLNMITWESVFSSSILYMWILINEYASTLLYWSWYSSIKLLI